MDQHERDWWEACDRAEFNRRLSGRVAFFETPEGKQRAKIVDALAADRFHGQKARGLNGAGVAWSAS